MIKKLFFLAVFLISSFNIHAQDSSEVSVEKSIWGVQTGLLGFWVHNEYGLSRTIALRSEVGLNGGFSAGSFVEDGFQWILAPTLNVEPRWYYNLDKRAEKGKVTAQNTANFFSIKANYNPDWFAISSSSNNSQVENLTATVNWGIKRTLWDHFTYEVGMGLGYGVEFWKQYGFVENDNVFVLALQLRLGYTF